jgi:hypothetical protein
MLPLVRLEGKQKSSAIYAYLFVSATLASDFKKYGTTLKAQ